MEHGAIPTAFANVLLQMYLPIFSNGTWRFEALDATRGTLAAGRSCSIYEFVAFYALDKFMQMEAWPEEVKQQCPFKMAKVAADKGAHNLDANQQPIQPRWSSQPLEEMPGGFWPQGT